METKITIYPDIKSVKDPYIISVNQALTRIKKGKNAELIQKIRSNESKDERDRLKQRLPSICFSGTFGERNNSSLKNHSGLICLDFDKVVNPTELKNKLRSDNTIYSAFISPSGNGVKALVRIPKNNHLASFLALKEKYPAIDDACKDVSRVCYESYDPEIWVNPHAKVFTKQIEVETSKFTRTTVLSDYFQVYELIKKWLVKKGEEFFEGNRNNYLCKLVSACNRFGIPKSEADRLIIYDYVNGSSNFKMNEFTSILNGVYSRYSGQHGSASFDEEEIVETKTKKVISEEVIDFSIPAKDIIRLQDVRQDMIQQFKKGIKKGQSTYFPKIDDIFRLIRGEVTLLFGIGNHGKSEMLNQLMLLQSIYNGTKWAVFSPESYPSILYYNKLIQMYIGKKVYEGTNKMSIEEYNLGMDFVNEHFFFLFPEEDEPTPDYIMDRFKEVKIKDNVDGIVIDPYNQMFHDYSIREDQYISTFLTKFKRFAVKNELYSIIVAHPNSRIETEDGNLKTPYYTHNLAGGMMWGNKCDNILCYHRPYYRTDPGDPSCVLNAQKIKRQDINGRPGLVFLNYNLNRFCYSQKDDRYTPMDEVWSRIPNEEFDLPDPIIKLNLETAPF